MSKKNLEERLRHLKLSNEESNKITRECIQTALIYLLNKNSLDKISIVEIVKKAGVSRSAFYKNYTSKKDVLFDFAKDILDFLSDSLSNDTSLKNPKQFFELFFMQIKSNDVIFKLLFREKIDVIDYLFKPVLSINDPMDKYRFIAMKKSLIAIVELWLEGGMKESVTKMADFCTEVLNPLL